ncbi:uncharacterized protein LOC110991224 [Acanthaster planci]|uniref:Uncharacterized protein LOC110991224 n=1 Tax=Acanthaster planci TaxID=133434 RepID=A0A8B8A389_ACAPL|nr:uncharacterized protein LOC110991224 [Acanthaster planci]XP_022112188.1 uncharacterized protein LOC110991224 [Acanthaster planci]
MGNRGNWYQQNLSTAAPAALRMAEKAAPTTATTGRNCQRESANFITAAFPDNNRVFTHHGRASMDGTGWEGPPARANTTLSSTTRSCWTVNGIHRNSPQRRSWPSQSRQSTTTPGAWQQTTFHRNTKVHTRQVQSQTPHHHVAALGLRRSKTCAEFAFTRRTTAQTHQSTADGSFSTLPKVHSTREGTVFFTSANGLADRASALKSLASNPHLQVETLNGTTRIFRTADRRPRSLPAKFSNSPFGENTLTPDLPEPQKVLYVSKHGYHPRSKSPTYPILIGTKDTLNLALCKKLWRIRRDLEGRKARENSVVYSEISQALIDEKDTEQWYEKMFDEHEQDDEEEEDQDMVAIESLRLANPDGEFAQSDESISTAHPRPHMDLLFDKKYLREHINDWSILGINIEEEERRSEQRLKTAPVARPTSAERKARVSIQMSTVKAKVSHRQTIAVNRDSKPARARGEHRATRLPAVPTTGRVFHARANGKKRGTRKMTKKPNLAQHSDEEVLPDLTNGEGDTRTPSPTFEFPLETPEDLELADMDRRKSLVSKYLHSTKLSESSPTPKETEDVPAEDADQAKTPEEEIQEEKPKELTEKEKFILMRKRMDERKAKMQKRREDFLDYSMLGIRSQRRRNAGDPGAPSGSKNSLGSLMSTRLESMATFKARVYQGEEVDEDDEEDEDENAEEDEEESGEDDS